MRGGVATRHIAGLKTIALQVMTLESIVASEDADKRYAISSSTSLPVCAMDYNFMGDSVFH